MPKYWVKNYFTHERFSEVGQKQKTEKERKKERKLVITMAKLRMVHAWRTQAAWAKKGKGYFPLHLRVCLFLAF